MFGYFVYGERLSLARCDIPDCDRRDARRKSIGSVVETLTRIVDYKNRIATIREFLDPLLRFPFDPFSSRSLSDLA